MTEPTVSPNSAGTTTPVASPPAAMSIDNLAHPQPPASSQSTQPHSASSSEQLIHSKPSIFPNSALCKQQDPQHVVSQLYPLLSHELVPPFLLKPPPLVPSADRLTPLPSLTPNPTLVLLPVVSKPPLTLGFAVSKRMATDAYATVVKHDVANLVVLIGQCNDHVELLVCDTANHNLSISRFDATRFRHALQKPSIAALNAAVLSTTTCAEPASASSPKDCKAKLMDCLRGVSKLAIFKRCSLDAPLSSKITNWFVNVARGRTNKFVCPISLLLGSRNNHPSPTREQCPRMAVWHLLSNSNSTPVQSIAPPPPAPRPILPYPEPQLRRLPWIAPAPPKPDLRSPTVLSEDEERRRKAELRKARNRESAQRSNHKRKMKLQALKEELEMVSQREKSLRERERHLRQENINLRMTVPR